MDDLSRFCCVNSECPEHGKRGAGNLTVTSRYGPKKARRMLRCTACKARVSEPKGTPLFDIRLPAAKVESVLEPRRRRTAIAPTRPMTARETPGTTSR
jgi:LacI family transcriptional regulator